MKSVTVRQALQQAANYPYPVTDEAVQLPVYELVARSLFDIANNPDAKVRGSMSRANRARKMILNRLGGKRRPGTTPVQPHDNQVEFIDLTAPELAP